MAKKMTISENTTPGTTVEVRANLGPLGKQWLRSRYAFSHVEAGGASCIVTHTGGPFDGAPVRYAVQDVRETSQNLRAG